MELAEVPDGAEFERHGAAVQERDGRQVEVSGAGGRGIRHALALGVAAVDTGVDDGAELHGDKLQHAQIAFPDMAGPPRALWDDGSAQASATIWISLQSWLFCQPLDQPWLALYRGHRQSSYARHSP